MAWSKKEQEDYERHARINLARGRMGLPLFTTGQFWDMDRASEAAPKIRVPILRIVK